MSKEIHPFFIDQLSGKVQFLIAEFWFKLLGQSFATGGLMFAGQKLDSIELNILAYISMGATYLWISHQLNKSMYYIWPETEPSAVKHQKPKRWQMFFVFSVPPVFLIIPFQLSMFLAQLVGQIKA
ncbi:hypothetical protein A9Q81_13630 [Gammaproteobacteria bacterium 42_54_T18]|nr:hypothetical protein A9Q81_13630 [Gammaproteobacteria bacterium 42_54_T18]